MWMHSCDLYFYKFLVSSLPLDQKLCIVDHSKVCMQSYDEGVKCFNYDNSLYLSKSSVISYLRPLHIFSSISIVITDCDIETDKIILLEGWTKRNSFSFKWDTFCKTGLEKWPRKKWEVFTKEKFQWKCPGILNILFLFSKQK